VITIDRPERRNAIDAEAARLLEEAIDTLENDEELWAGVLTGAASTFSSGADMKARLAGERVTNERGLAGLTRRERTKPLIAAVEGLALAGGFELVLACDLVVAARDARFGLPEVKRSVVPAEGGLVRAPRVLPRNVAMELVVTGEPITADRLYALGVVSRVCDPGSALATALELATAINANAPLAVREGRAVVAAASDMAEAEAWATNDAAYARIKRTEDFREGPRAFVEKRAPRWTGR
jgi:enoyl-CoA hydratase